MSLRYPKPSKKKCDGGSGPEGRDGRQMGESNRKEVREKEMWGRRREGRKRERWREGVKRGEEEKEKEKEGKRKREKGREQINGTPQEANVWFNGYVNELWRVTA